jgi:carbonic anhydrase/acetyltransferase-like protein (isoleucine patch superfamily)
MSRTRFRPELVHPSVFLAGGAVVVGDVELAEDASVWFNAVLRGDLDAIRVGAGSNIQDGAVLHVEKGFPCLLGARVTVSHGAIVHGAAVEDDVLIGVRATVMTGARIGAGSIVGTGALVLPNTVVPPGSLVLGSPGKVRQQLGEAELQGNRRTAAFYVAEAKAYRNGE